VAGPPPQEQIDATLAWVTDAFRDHYRRAPPELPPRFGRREFGFLWNGKKFFLRHTGFASPEAFRDFLAREAPHHCYYSTAYYKTPHAPTMKEKEWLGADLIFDLDADHLPGGDKMSFAEQLAAVKRQARKLLEEFILGDLGFEEEHVRIVFSGGRGYHFHVTDPRVLALDSAARREIVDYISPNEIVAAALAEGYVRRVAWETGAFGAQRDNRIPPADAGGWDGLLTRTILATIRDAVATGQPPRVAGVGEATWREIIERATPERLDEMARTGLLTIPALNNKRVLHGFVEYAKVHAEGETDEPVTADVKRLIRLPGSLHGKTGLRVTPLTREEFDRFDPLRDAVALGDEPVRVVVGKPTEVPLLDRPFTAQPGEQELPLYAAAFLVLRRAALRPRAA
jgi:DNA primase small subunit